MRNFVIYILFIASNLLFCYGQERQIKDTLFEKVSFKLERDDKSFIVFNSLLNVYFLNQQFKYKSSGCYFDLYACLYNRGIPLVRLIKKDSLEDVFDELCKKRNRYNKSSIRRKYKIIVRNLNNYNTDDDIGGINEQQYYFSEFMKQYYILPKSK